MKKIRMRFTAFVLTMALIITAMPISVFANQSELKSEGNMRTIIESDFSDIHNMEYTYKENGEIFKAVENISEDFSKVKTKIFKKVNNEFILFKESETIIKENNDNFEIVTMNLTNGERKTNISKKPVEQIELLDKSLQGPLYSTYSETSPYPRYEPFKIKNGNLVTDALEIAAITAAFTVVFGLNKLTTTYVKNIIKGFASTTAAIIFAKGYRMTYYTNRTYISIYLEARPTDPFYKYWDSVYTNSARTNLISEKEYDSGAPN